MKKKPLYQQIYVDLKNKIYNNEIAENEQLPTEKELADIYGVSAITIKSALNLLVTDDLVIRQPGKGSFIKTKDKSKHIGVLMNGLAISYGTEFLSRLTHELNAQGYTLSLSFSNESIELEEACLRTFYENKVDGIIVVPIQNRYHNPYLMELIIKDFPIVVVDRELDGVRSLFVGSDNHKAAFKMTELLLENGHKNISIVSRHNLHNSTIRNRVTGIQDALIENNIIPNHDIQIDFLASDYIFSGNTSKNYDTMEVDIENTANFIVSHPEITCFFCLNYPSSEVIYKAIKKIRKKVPDDYSIVCFDSPQSVLIRDFFTTLNQDETKMAITVAQLIIDKISNKTIENTHILINPSISMGRSIKKIN